MPRGMGRTHKRGYWKPFIKAVDAMEPDTLLIWEMPHRDCDTAQSRVSDLCHSEFKASAHWLDGKLFVVRMR